VKVSANAGWAHEALEFTPWLAANLDRLGEAVGMALELRAREHPVGKYWLDLLLQDAQERTVIVENQFGQTDHDHLGKLLTYCAGTEADVVIWIAERLNEEHIAALEWLNDSTVQGVGFFGVELELLRIGDSALAPHFHVVVKPNEWVKSVRPAQAMPVEWTWELYGQELGLAQERLAIGRALVERVTAAIDERGLPWQPRFRKGYVAFQRAGGYNVVVVDLLWNKPPRLAIKIPAPPAQLGMASPFPGLAESWNEAEHEWGWTVSSIDGLLDVGDAIEIALPYNSGSGPMDAP
jgi:hypothetical protein